MEMASNVFGDKMLNRFDWDLGFRAGTGISRHVQLFIGYDWGMKNKTSMSMVWTAKTHLWHPALICSDEG